MHDAEALEVELALKKLGELLAGAGDAEGERALPHVPALLEACLTSRDGVAVRPLGGDELTSATVLGLAVRVRCGPDFDYMAIGVAPRNADDDPALAWRELAPWCLMPRPRALLGRLHAWSLDERADRLVVRTDTARRLAVAIRRDEDLEGAQR